jgi:sigma-B regulation protein RsbU (phosphoserine phosphatase)
MPLANDLPHVLLADDQPDVLESLRLLLGPEGFRTEAVTTPDQVVASLARGRVDLLLMDLNYTRDTTSGVEGLTLVDRIRAVEPLLPIVAMTGWSTVELAVEAMRKGVRHFVQKPWDNDALVSLVRSEVEQGRTRRRMARQQRRELEEAQVVQRSLLPHSLPVLPGVELAVHWQPASGVGGDAFDVALLDEQRLAISVADVAGKGLPAALLMSNVQGTIRAVAAGSNPAEICGHLNRTLVGQIPEGRFVTLVLAVLDPRTRRVVYSNAGHNQPVRVGRDGAAQRLDRGGPVLGVVPDATYELGALTLEPGDRLVFFTDGIVEATDGRDEFGEERFVALVQAHRALPARDLVARIVEEVQAFSHDLHADDATVVALAVEG